MSRINLWMVLFCLLCTGYSCQPTDKKADKKPVITVAVAANVQFAMQELEAAFEARYPIQVETVISSSGKLAAQIMQGAPYSIFLAANMEYPDKVKSAGYAASKVEPYAEGTLVLWTTKSISLDSTLAILVHPSTGKIAIANPKNAPYGKEAINALKYFERYDAALPRLVYGESIAQTNQYILSGVVDAGITAKSAVMAPAVSGAGKWVSIPAKAYQPIRQGAIITRYGIEQEEAASRQFWSFLFSSEAQRILSEYGYKVDIGTH
jgi:molybdate transport system substrate-binding protein